MIGRIVMALGAVSVIVGGIWGYATSFHTMVYALVPVGVLMLVVGLVQAVNSPD